MQSSLLANMTLNQCVFASFSPRAGISHAPSATSEKVSSLWVCVTWKELGSHPQSEKPVISNTSEHNHSLSLAQLFSFSLPRVMVHLFGRGESANNVIMRHSKSPDYFPSLGSISSCTLTGLDADWIVARRAEKTLFHPAPCKFALCSLANYAQVTSFCSSHFIQRWAWLQLALLRWESLINKFVLHYILDLGENKIREGAKFKTS